MNPQDYDKNNDQAAILSIEHELYDPKAKVPTTEVHRLKSKRSLALPSSWGDEAPLIVKGEEEKGMSFGTKLLIIATIILMCALGFSVWRVMSLRNVVSAANIDMQADITPYIEGGEQTPLSVTLRNRNTAPLENGKITLLYKQGNGAQDEQEKKEEKVDLGTIAPGMVTKKDFTVSLYGSESETRDLTLKLEYNVAGSNAIFTKIITTQVILKTPPISVSVSGPDKLSIGQNGTYTFVVKNNSATSSIPSVLTLMLPSNFTIDSADPKPIPRSLSWGVDSLPKGGTKTVTVTGSFDGKQGDTGTFSAKVGSQGENPSDIGIVYSSVTTDVALRSSPLVLNLNVSNDVGISDSIKYGDKTRLTLNYSNGSLEPLEDLSIVISLSGDAVVYNNVDPTTGYYDSIAKTITWNKATFPDFAVIPPNGQGTLQVNLPIVVKGTNSPALKITVTGVATSKSADDIVTSVTKNYAVSGSASLIASTQYKNSSFANTGPIPPQPNQDTTYTVSLRVAAQNAIGNTKVSFTLPAYVTWRNVTSDQRVTYESKTRTVTWNIGHIDQAKTVTADIGLSVRPSQSHVGQSPVITSGIILDADEEASREHLKSTLSPLTTVIKNEVWSENPSIVVDR
jgi:uncharacterized repeat protein (TIGR01451 family)